MSLVRLEKLQWNERGKNSNYQELHWAPGVLGQDILTLDSEPKVTAFCQPTAPPAAVVIRNTKPSMTHEEA